MAKFARKMYGLHILVMPLINYRKKIVNSLTSRECIQTCLILTREFAFLGRKVRSETMSNQ